MAAKFTIPGTTYIGDGALAAAGSDICALGTKALIVTGQSMIKQGFMKVLTDILEQNGVGYVIDSKISGEPTDVMIEEGLLLYQENACDFIIGFGGGSPLDSAKAIGAMVTNPGKISDYNGKVIQNPIPPLAAIPSTAGTGSEVTQFTIISDTKNQIKMLLKGSVLLPDIAVVDPQFTMSTPKSVTAATGLDALTHAVEAYTSKKATAQTDLYAVSAVKKIFTYLPRVYADGSDKEAREAMSAAAYEAGRIVWNLRQMELMSVLQHLEGQSAGQNPPIPMKLRQKNLLRLWEKSVKSAKCRHWKNMVLTEKNFSKLSERWRRMPMTAEAQAIQEKQLLLKIWK